MIITAGAPDLRSLEAAISKLEELKQAAEKIPALEAYIEAHYTVFGHLEPGGSDSQKPQPLLPIIIEKKPTKDMVKIWAIEQLKLYGVVATTEVKNEFPSLGIGSVRAILSCNPKLFKKLDKGIWGLSDDLVQSSTVQIQIPSGMMAE